MSRSRRLFRLLFVLLLLGGLGFAWLVGWFERGRDWRETTGVDQLAKPAFFPYRPDGPNLYWLGHAGFLIQWHQQWFVVDPNLSDSCGPVPRLFAQPPTAWPQRIDFALISHAHYDHFDIPSLSSLPVNEILAPQGLQTFLPSALKTRFQGLRQDERLSRGRLTLTALTTQHRGGRSHPLPSAYAALSYLIDDGHTRLYIAGDTGYGPHFRQIGEQYQPELAILPIGAYEPHFLLKPHHLNPEEAVQAARDLGVSTVVPGHFGTFRLAAEAPEAALPRFAQAAEGAPFTWYLAPFYQRPMAPP